MALLILLLPTRAAAQRSDPDVPPPRRVDVEVLHVTGSWLFPLTRGWALGPELGGGLLEQKTLLPSGDDFTSILHLGAVSSRSLSSALSLDLGLRLGLAELRSRSCSGCLPEAYGALIVGFHYGGDTIRGGTRVTVGQVVDDGFLAWSPLTLRFRF